MKSGHRIATVQPLPDVTAEFVTAQALYAMICHDAGGQNGDGHPRVTLLDLRTENLLGSETSGGSRTVVKIKTARPIVYAFFDDLQRPDVRDRIPKDGLVVVVTETGNRDQFAIQYLSAFGYTNIKGLQFGMRGWIKEGLPIE